jgi:hypothetical protein
MMLAVLLLIVKFAIIKYYFYLFCANIFAHQSEKEKRKEKNCCSATSIRGPSRLGTI